ncbi:uncharacterized protein LOC131666693 isoform X2 [Phymastichus coffea]|uniref:uncharacterized protein LOC131666693 isoform X2 n=1 Tax=Phymastichus coffea TaxID=108790 RepID=UPI00273B1D4D|nr:uncharacterized protein LOC131666693 isoform X2 [Phymastichus coffea]
MASREKKALAPSKSKQKANNNNSSQLADTADNVTTRVAGGKKSRNLVPNPRNKQARELLEAIATNSQLSIRDEAALPRKRALQTALKRKKVKKTLIKVKQKLPDKTLKRTTDPKKQKKNKSNKAVSDSSLDSGLESEDAKNKSKTGKKLKASTKTSGEIKVEVEEKSSPKLVGKRFKESSPKSAKNNKQLAATAAQKRQESKEREIKIEPLELKHIKTEPVNDSYELTIEEVIASSMLVEPGIKIKSEESAGDLKGKKHAKTAKRSLRNGKLRQSLQKGETEPRRSVSMSETGVNSVESLSLPDTVVDVKIEREDPEEQPDKEEEEAEEEQEGGDNNVHSDVETNNNAEAGENGPTLRSKTKARNSDSSDEIKSENGDLKKDKMPAKIADVKSAMGVSNNNTPKSRRSSLNINVEHSPMFTGSIDKMTPDGTSLVIDEMIDKIKLSIVKSIEKSIENTMIMSQAFEPLKREEITATIHNEVIVPSSEKDADDDKSSVSKNRGLGPSMAKKDIKSEDTENAVPKVADTAKEIEKLVMGESEPNNEKETAEEQPEPQADVANIASVVKVADADPMAKESSTTTEYVKDSKQSEEMKKSSLPNATRKSTRVTAGRSSAASERQRSLCSTEINNEIEKTNSEEQKAEQDQKSNEVDDETKTSSKGDESTNANKTDTASEVIIAAAEKTEEAMDVNNSTEVNKESESFDDLASSLDKLVEDAGKETSMKVPENDSSSDVEMNLVIDEEESSLADNSEIKDNKKEGCDQKPGEVSAPNPAIVPEQSKPSKEIVAKVAKESETVVGPKETRRSLRTRASDKLRKAETAKPVRIPTPVVQDKSEMKVVKTENAATSEVPSAINTQNEKSIVNTTGNELSTNQTSNVVIKTEPIEQPEPQMRTRRSREAKKPIQTQTKGRRGPKKQDAKKVEAQQQTKEDSLLDNEVASINESSSSFVATEESVRGVSASERRKSSASESKNRSKSENDVRSTNISRERSTSEDTNPPTESQSTKAGSNGISQKDLDEASTSGESSSSVDKIHETPEDRAKKEAILRHLGLESWEKVHERKKKEESGYTGTLKTVIRIPKEGKNYTIQKEGGPSATGDSTSDDENEDSTVKDRQSLVIPEKSSSFSIHPGRLCADNCCYCHGKFGSLDTPMHLAQMKSDERRKKILENEVHLTKDSCLCDACYRHVDRKANMSPTNMQLKPQRSRHSIMECMVVNCTESARHHVKRRWLLRIKSSLKDQLMIKWDTTQHSTLTMFCGAHYAQIEKFLMCTLCRRRLTRNFTYPVGMKAADVDDLNKTLQDKGMPATMQANAFFCRLCKYFVGLFVKHSDIENMSANNKNFYKNYRKKLLFFFNCPEAESDEEAGSGQSGKNKSKNNGNGTSKKSKKSSMSGIDLPGYKLDIAQTSSATASDKSSPEPCKSEPSTSRTKEPIPSTSQDSRPSGIETAIEKLKKRKALSTSISLLPSDESNKNGSTKGVAELLSRDKEITLTRLPPKRPRLENNTSNNDITPVVQRLGANPSISVRTLFPGEEEMNLHANIEFNNVREVTPQGWEKCATMIQYDRDTKMLWQELQRPYGNQSSFLRHLILLEKYYRAGDLILAPNASRNAINYSTSVQNRLISYEGPEKMEETMESHNTIELNNSRRLSGGYVLEQRSSAPSTSTSSSLLSVTSQLSKMEPSSRVMKLTPGVSIIKKPPPSLQRLNVGGGQNGSTKRKDAFPVQKGANVTGGKVFQLTEPDFKKLQNLKRQKQIMNERNSSSPNSSSGRSNSSLNNYRVSVAYDADIHKSQTLFRKHLLMQQEMLNQRSRGDFEPLVCEMRSLSNENSPTQNLINHLNLPKSIQVTTKPSTGRTSPVPILPKIPKSLTVIPQTVPRAQDK